MKQLFCNISTAIISGFSLQPSALSINALPQPGSPKVAKNPVNQSLYSYICPNLRKQTIILIKCLYFSIVDILARTLGDKAVAQNQSIEFVNIELNQKNFFHRFFFAHFFTVYIAYFLGKYNDAEGRDLISITAGNPWWSQKSIEAFPSCTDIPGILNTQEAKEEALV